MLTQAEYGRFRTEAVRRIATETVRDPPGEDDTVSLATAVSGWLDDNYDEHLGGYDPEAVEQVVPVDPEQITAGATTPLREGDGDGDERQRLHAYRAVRTDLLDELADSADGLATAIAVHDALERLVGARGPPTDRRPSEVVEAFASWTVDRHDGPDPGQVLDSFTVLHVMRIAVLDAVDGDHMAGALEEWLASEHPDAYDDGVSVER